MPVYKVTYFNLKALAEPIRFLLSYGELPFEDIRVEREDWPKIKETMPMGQMPVLEIDGKKVHQSVSICRYLAKQVGLAGSTDFEAFEIDSVVDTCNDFRQKISSWAYENDATLKAEKRKAFNDEVGPFYLSRLEAIAKENNGHLALGKTTWADLWFTAVLDYLNFLNETNLIENYPFLTKVVQNTLAIENIKKWIAKRPQTQG